MKQYVYYNISENKLELREEKQKVLKFYYCYKCLCYKETKIKQILYETLYYIGEL